VDYTFRDPSRPTDERVAKLMELMTLEEKVAQLGCVWITSMLDGDRFDEDAARRLMPGGIGQITRIGASTVLDAPSSAALMNAAQRFAVERTRLGIPLLVHEESLAGYCARGATVFPQAIGLAASWDAGLVHEIASAIREQMRAVGARQALAPVLDIARDPRWGRVEETYGEDPVLAGVLGTAYVRGLQTDDLSQGVVATGKHFLAHAMSIGGRNHAPVHVGPRELREVYAEPFAAAIRDAGLASIMNSYTSVDGLPCAGSAEILTALLRDELGFDGTVVADYWAVIQLHRYHRTAANRAEAGMQALRAGLDVELPVTECYGAPLLDALAQGHIEMELIDRAVERVLRQKMALGLFERPYVEEAKAGAVFETPAQRALARRAAASSLVLLSNDGVLPLAGENLRRVAVIGPAADDRALLQGDYHYPTHQAIVGDGNGFGEGGPVTMDDELVGGPALIDTGGSMLPESGETFHFDHYWTDHVTPLAGIRAALADRAEVVYHQGCTLDGTDRSGLAPAEQAARDADVAIVVVGGRSGLQVDATVGEGRDATDLDLTGVQEDLIRAVAATGTPTVVVVLSGRVHTLAGVVEAANAVLQGWPLGEEGGHALAHVLLGRCDPGGRLPVTLPRHVGQLPVHASPRAGGSKAMFRGGYTDAPATPLFCFGHGLSYTRFEYGPLELAATTTEEVVSATVEVTNVGGRPGVEVVQLYASDFYATVARPGRQLVGFCRLELEAGERRRVSFTVHPSRLAFYDQEMRFVVEPGTFGFAVGSSAEQLPSQGRVELTGPRREYRQRDIVATAVREERLSPAPR
jgi:beta-glucosidase